MVINQDDGFQVSIISKLLNTSLNGLRLVNQNEFQVILIKF